MNRCHLCKGEFFAPSFKLLLFHIGRVHASSPDFYLPCGIDNCQVTFTNFHAFKRHLRKKHSSHLSDIEAEHDLDCDITDRDSVASSTTLEPSGDVSDYFMGDDETSEESSSTLATQYISVDRERAIALWILKLKEGRKLTQSATEEILQDVTELCGGIITNLKSDIYTVLSAAGINVDDVSGLEDLFQDESSYVKPFSKLETQYLQMSYYKSHLGFIVSILLLLI